MTGLERLRNVANAMRGYTVHGGGPLDLELMGIADRIEREAASDPADDVSMSAYDLLPDEDLDAIAWVRDHGGIGECDRKVEASIEVGDKYTLLRMELGKLLGLNFVSLIVASDEELVEKVGKRLMPEDMEWPRFETGEPVKLGDSVEDEDGDEAEVAYITFHEDHVELGLFNGAETYPVPIEQGERVKLPAPEVLDAYGEEIREGDTVCGTRDMEPMRVVDTDSRECGFKRIKCEKEGEGFFFYCADELTHKLPVLAADGKPLREGEAVWSIDGATYRVTGLHDGEVFARHIVGSFGGEVESAGGGGLYRLRAEQLTHERSDSWEQLEEDCAMKADDYARKRMGIDPKKTPSVKSRKVDMARDLVRRAKKLAGVER